MYSILFAILMGLLSPSKSGYYSGNGTVQVMNDGDDDDDGEKGTGGDVGDIIPPRPPQPPKP